MKKLPIYLLLIALTVVFLGPFVFSFMVSISEDKTVINHPERIWTTTYTLKNYKSLWTDLPFFDWLTNSLIISAIQTVTNVFLSALAGFTFARLDFPYKNLIFNALLFSLMIPGIILLIPKFLIVNQLGLINTFPGLILPGMVTVVNIFLMKQFFETIPKDLEQAALIDGCSYFRMFWQIFIPISKPALAAVAIYTFQGTWNEFLWVLISTTTKDMFTLPVGMASLRYELQTDWTLLMAGTLIISLPTILIFLFFQKYFVQGVASSGLKE
jgi:multiple sugar transport system permease protein